MRRERKEDLKKKYDFNFGTFIGRFPSDGAASLAVKGLRLSTMLCRDIEDDVDLYFHFALNTS